jgi:hypothetical protein
MQDWPEIDFNYAGLQLCLRLFYFQGHSASNKNKSVKMWLPVIDDKNHSTGWIGRKTVVFVKMFFVESSPYSNRVSATTTGISASVSCFINT